MGGGKNRAVLDENLLQVPKETKLQEIQQQDNDSKHGRMDIQICSNVRIIYFMSRPKSN